MEIKDSVIDTDKRFCGFTWLLATRTGGVGEELCTVDAASFIAHVPAVVLLVALAAAMDASAITAFELIRAAGGTS